MEWFQDPAQFRVETASPWRFTDHAGPVGVAAVRVYSEGRTAKGWGLTPRGEDPGFMANYKARKFWGQTSSAQPFAFIMRSLNIVAIDIDRHLEDGGADGFIAAAKLKLPPTLAQASKGGEGRHLFYFTEEEWNPETGFGQWDDVLGIAPGIDIRTVGCVYHYPHQRWNDRAIAPLPDNVRELLDNKQQQKAARTAVFAAAAAAPPESEEALIMHDALLRELNKPVDAGKRNMTLFAIGSQMLEAKYPKWEGEIQRRGEELGLSDEEVNKIVANIEKYQP